MRAIHLSKITFLALGVALGVALGSGCVKKGDVTEASPILVSVSTFKTASVTLTAPPEANTAGLLKASLMSKLRESKLFADVPEEGGELVIQLNVKSIDKGSALATQLAGNAGAAEVTLEVTFIASTDKKTIGQVFVSGNSKQDSSTTIGGIDTRLGSDQTARAYAAAADQVVEYLSKHR